MLLEGQLAQLHVYFGVDLWSYRECLGCRLEIIFSSFLTHRDADSTHQLSSGLPQIALVGHFRTARCFVIGR